MNFTFLQADQAAQGQGSMMPMLIMLVAMFVIMYFFMTYRTGYNLHFPFFIISVFADFNFIQTASAARKHS